jgi:hypothetical protein
VTEEDCVLPRRRDIEAAIAARNAADPEALLPPEAGRLLAVMFRRSSVCQRSLDDLAAEGFNRSVLRRLLPVLVEAGSSRRSRNQAGAQRTSTASTCRRWCADDEQPPREGLRASPFPARGGAETPAACAAQALRQRTLTRHGRSASVFHPDGP